MGEITSSNVQVFLTVEGVFGVGNPQQLQGFAADDAFTAEAFDVAETRMGVDGNLSAGYTPSVKRWTVTLQPDSPCVPIFDEWYLNQAALKQLFVGGITIDYPALSKTYDMSVCWLKNYKPMGDAKKVIDPQTFTIEYQDVVASPT